MALFGGSYDAGPAVRALGQGLNIANADIQQGIGQLRGAYAAGLQPYQQLFGTGTQGIDQYGNLVGLGTMDPAQISAYLQQTPGYQFNLTQGLQGIDRGAASRGMLTSGNTLGAEQQYGAGLASNTYQQALQNLNPYFGLGTSGAQGIGALNASLGNQLMGAYGNMGNLAMNAYGAAGQAETAANIANANAQNSLFGNILGLGTKLLGYGMPGGGTIGGSLFGGLFGGGSGG